MNHHKYIENLERKYDVIIGHRIEPGIGLGRDSLKSIRKYKKQLKEYGFDERDTWAVWRSASICLYERMKMFMELAPKIVDYTFYEFDVPVLIKNKKEIYMQTEAYFHKEYRHMKQIEAMNLMIKYLEKGLVLSEGDFRNQQKGMEHLQVAFEIFSIIMPAVWW